MAGWCSSTSRATTKPSAPWWTATRPGCSTSSIGPLETGNGRRTSCRRSLSACSGISTASIRPKSSRPGSTPSRRTSRRTSFGTAAVTPWCCSRRSRSTGRDHRPLQFEDTTARPDDLYRKRFLKEAVDQCVDQLPTHHRAVFVLRELEGKSYAEIADITGCNLGTVKSRLNRARNSFAQLIEPLLE